MHFAYHGRRNSNNRLFQFEYNGSTEVTYRDQLDIVQWVQGTHPDLDKWPSMKLRRIREWFDWATDGNGGDGFHRYDLPYIASAFRHCWDASIPANMADLSASDLAKVKAEIVSLLDISGLIPTKRDECIVRRLSIRARDVDAGDDGADAAVDRRVRQRREGSNDLHEVELEESCADMEDGVASILNYGSLKKKWFVDKEYIFVGSLEIVAKEAHNDEGSLLTANTYIVSHGGDPFPESVFEEFCLLGKRALSRKRKNFETLRREINAKMQVSPSLSRPVGLNISIPYVDM
jgi:hypothetical protein